MGGQLHVSKTSTLEDGRALLTTQSSLRLTKSPLSGQDDDCHRRLHVSLVSSGHSSDIVQAGVFVGTLGDEAKVKWDFRKGEKVRFVHLFWINVGVLMSALTIDLLSISKLNLRDIALRSIT